MPQKKKAAPGHRKVKSLLAPKKATVKPKMIKKKKAAAIRSKKVVVKAKSHRITRKPAKPGAVEIVAEKKSVFVPASEPRPVYQTTHPVHHDPDGAQLPHEYHEDKMILQVRDPWWLYVYWEVKQHTLNDVRNRFNGHFQGARFVLRVYDVSFIHFNGKNAHRFFDIDIPVESRAWYIDVGEAGRSWCVDLGFHLPDGTFITIIRSNVVTTPIDGPSWMTDEQWMIPEDKFARLYGMGFGLGFGGSSPSGKMLTEQLKKGGLKMPNVSSPTSLSSPFRGFGKDHKQKNFWFFVDAELVVYGATESDAKVTICGEPVALNGDGTFSLRFALPNGKQIIPLEARPADNSDYRSITPIVIRETH